MEKTPYENNRKLYDKLLTSKKVTAEELGDFDTFNLLVGKADKAKKLYNNLTTKKGFTKDELGEEADFMHGIEPVYVGLTVPQEVADKAAEKVTPSGTNPFAGKPITSPELSFGKEAATGEKMSTIVPDPLSANPVDVFKSGSIVPGVTAGSGESSQQYFEEGAKEMGGAKVGATKSLGVVDQLHAQYLRKAVSPKKADEYISEKIVDSPTSMASYFDNVGKSFAISGKQSLAEVGIAIEDQALKVNELMGRVSDNPSWASYIASNEQRIGENLKGLKDFKESSGKLSGKPGEFIGAMLPMAGMAAASIVSKSPAVASAMTGIFGEMGYGSGIEAYDAYAKATGKPVDEAARVGSGILYGAAMSVPMSKYLGKMLPKGILQKTIGYSLSSNPAATASLGREIFQNFAKKSPDLAKKLMQAQIEGAGHGVATMELMELSKKAVDQYLMGRDVSPEEWWDTVTGAAASGALFGVITAPFSVYAQNTATKQRREQQGSVTLTMDEATGAAVEIIPSGSGQQKGMTPDGKIVDVTPDMAAKSFTMPTKEFNEAMEVYKTSGEIDPMLERKSYSGRVSNMLDRVTMSNGRVYVHTDKEGNPFYILSKNKDNTFNAVDTNGTAGVLPADVQIKSVMKEDVHTGLMNKFDSAQKAQAKQDADIAVANNYTTQRDQAAEVVKQNFDKYKHPDGTLRTAILESPEGIKEEIIILPGESGSMSILADGRMVATASLKETKNYDLDTLLQQQMAEFDMENAPAQKAPQAQSVFKLNGKDMMLIDVSDKDNLLIQEIDSEGEPVGRPETISSDQYRKVLEQEVKAPGTVPEISSFKVGGKDYNFTPAQDGKSFASEAITSPEEAEQLRVEVEKQIGQNNNVTVQQVSPAEGMNPASYSIVATPKEGVQVADGVSVPEADVTQDLLKDTEASYMLSGQPIERGKALARVEAAIFDKNPAKIKNLEINGDEELRAMIEKAFPVKMKIGQKNATTRDALNWIDAADTLEELRRLKIEGDSPSSDVRTAYTLKVKELTPETSPAEQDKLVQELFAQEPAETEIKTETLKTQQDDNSNGKRVSGSGQGRETVEQARPDGSGSATEVAASGDGGNADAVVGDAEGRASVRAKDKGTPAPTEKKGVEAVPGKSTGALRKKSPSKLADLYKTRLSKLKKDNPKTYWSVDLPSDEELLQAAKDGRIVDMNGGMAYVTKDGDLKGLFKYDPAAKGTAKVLQAERIKLGGNKLDAYDTEGTGEVSLVPTYKKNGFREVARVDFNPEFAPEDMPANVKAMNPDVVVMLYDPENSMNIKERRFNKDQYEDALEYRDSYLSPEPVPDHNKSADTQEFFSDVVTGKSDKFKPKKAWEPIMDLSEKEQAVRPVFDKFNGNFDTHIATSIPGFRDIQIKVVSALNEMYKGKQGLIYDIGGSEGGFVKTLTELSDGKMESINLDANSDMENVHNASPVAGSKFVKEAFGEGFEWEGVTYNRHEPAKKADIVHESMTFQFIDEKRADKIDEVVNNYLKPDGLFISEEKVHPKDPAQWAANEAKKDTDFKLRYYEPNQISAKKEEVLTGMAENQTTYARYKNELMKRFDHVAEYWDSGNFKGIAASNDKAKLDEFLKQVGDTDTEFSEKNIKLGEKPAFKRREAKRKPFSLLDLADETKAPLSGNDLLKAFGDVNLPGDLREQARLLLIQSRTAGGREILSKEIERLQNKIAFHKAASEVNTNPTEAQKLAGNYKMGHATVQGMDITIESPRDSVRKGTDEDGKAWETKMKAHYGYFKGTVGKDGDHVDTFIGENPDSPSVFVVDQNFPATGEFDESKVMLGYNTKEEAKAAYLANYEPGWQGLRDITEVPVDAFKKWLYDGARQRKPFAEYTGIAPSFQARKLYEGKIKVPQFKNLGELANWLNKWNEKNKVFASEEAKADDATFVKQLVKHTMDELKAFEELSDYPYLGFYDYDIPSRLNPELQRFAEKHWGRELTPAEIALYHLVSGFASPQADPVMDSSKGLDVFKKYMDTGVLDSKSDKQATEWKEVTLKSGKKTKEDTGIPKFDEQGNPIMSNVTMAYAEGSLNKFRDRVLAHFNGDLDKAIEWTTTRHPFAEISEMMGLPVKGDGVLKVHEYLTKEDGGFGIFGFTGVKLGSYVLNRLGEYSTVTKDMWYARTLARLTGEDLRGEKKDEALKKPWTLTVADRRKRELADKAWGIVAKKLGTTPADVQQKMWEFEKRLYEKLGAKGSSGVTGYASEGFTKRAKELEPSLYEEMPAVPKRAAEEGSQPSAPVAFKRKEAGQVMGLITPIAPKLQSWEDNAKLKSPVYILDNSSAYDHVIEKHNDQKFAEQVRDDEWWGFQLNGDIVVHPDSTADSALLTWAHEKAHVVLESSFRTASERDAYLNSLYNKLGKNEIRRVVPMEYWFTTGKEQMAKEYLAHLVEDLILEEGLIDEAPDFVKSIIFDQVDQFTDLKYLHDEKRSIIGEKQGQEERVQNVGKTDTGATPEVAGDSNGGADTSGEGVRQADGREGVKKVFSFDDLFEPSFSLKPTGETIMVDGKERPVLNSLGEPIHTSRKGLKNFWRWFGDSQVTDSEGRPLVVYHGTPESGFNVFDEAKGRKKTNAPESTSFFSDNKNVAWSYSGSRRAASLREANGTKSGIYEVYLKITEPNMYDFEGADWQGYAMGKFEAVIAGDHEEAGNNIYNKEGGRYFDTREEAEQAASDAGISEEDIDIISDPNVGYSTNGLVQEALRMKGFDGAIAFNVVDTGQYGAGEELSNVYVVFNPEQIKSVTDNNGSFDPTDPRIDYKRKPGLSVDKKQVVTKGERFRELLVNNKQALENWMKDVETVVPKIEDYENPMLKDALAKSKVTTKLRDFEQRKYKRLLDSVADVLKTTGMEHSDLSHYLIAVHGVERNNKFWANKPKSVGQDFSGLSELKSMAEAKADPAEKLVIAGMSNEAFARYYAAKVEAKLTPAQTIELWNSIKSISKAVRDEMLDSGMISAEYNDELEAMYDNYIPLRAWEASNPEEFEFSRGVGGYTEPIIQAKGRKSLAEDPLATLLQMANTAYISGERNRVKRAAGLLVRNNQAALKDIVQYKRVYFVKAGTDAQGNPIIVETIDRPDQDAFDKGLVSVKTPKQYTARRTSAQAKEFEVEFYENGKKYVLVFQGSDPAVARAINNKEASAGLDYLNKVTSTDLKIGKTSIPSISKMSRYLSAINTTYSVDFPLVNFLRDAPMAMLSEWVYGSTKEAAKMLPQMVIAESAIRRRLKGKVNLANPVDQRLEDFFAFGAPTGFAFLKNVDEFKQSLKADVRRINNIKNPIVRLDAGFRKGLELVGQLAEWSETITRFAVYNNHIEAGESKEKAALAAKNATVNFDQKGRVSPALNGLYTFFNAAVQAVDKYTKMWGQNWKKMAALHMFLTVQGFLNAMLLDMFAGKDKDGVRNYDKVSDYTKRNNLVIPTPWDNENVTFPMPQILRKFHGLGFDAYDMLTNKKQTEQVLTDILANLPSDLSPIDVESFVNGDGDLSVRPLVPSILKPIAELEANENFMKMPISPEPFSLEQASRIADTRRAYKDVNKLAQWTTDKLYELGGGDNTGFKYVYKGGEIHTVPALLDYSPESIEHLFESYFGGVGKLANRTWKTTQNVYGAGKKLMGGADFTDAIKEVDVNVVPVVNRFVRSATGNPLEKEFRKVRNDYESKIKVMKLAEKEGDWVKFQKMYEEIGGKMEAYKAIMSTFEELDKEYSKRLKDDPAAAEMLKDAMKEPMKEIIKLK